MYDYIIIGGGPCGLVSSYYLSQKGYKVLLLERESVLGGCHRVINNDENLHMEHSPRIYPSSFYNFFNFLEKELDIKKYETFITSTFQLYSMEAIKLMLKMNNYDILKLSYGFIKNNIIQIKFPSTYTIKNFVEEYNFKSNSIEVINNICNLIDGGDIDKTLLSTFMEAIDKLSLYKILEPNKPLDKLIFNKFQDKLIKQNVEIYIDTEVIKIDKVNDNYKVYTKNDNYLCNKLLFAIPPFAINKIENAVEFLGYNNNLYSEWSNYNLYKDYISFTFEFDTQLENTFNKWGGIQEHIWGEMFIDMSHYFQNQKGSLIIMTISNLDEIDPETNKTPNQMNRTELIERVKNILLNKLNTTIQPIKYNMYPSIKKINNKWTELDKPFLMTDKNTLKSINNNTNNTNNIYSIGHHNKNSHHTYNTIESAVVNTLTFLNNNENFNLNIITPLSFSNLFITFIILTIIYFIIQKKYIL